MASTERHTLKRAPGSQSDSPNAARHLTRRGLVVHSSASSRRSAALMRRSRGTAAVLWLALLLLGLHKALAVRFGAGLVRRASSSADAASAVSDGGTAGGRGRGCEFNAWTQRIKGEIATRWDQGIAQRRNNGSGKATERQVEEYGGSQTLRMLQFWSRAFVIYNDYKTSQVRIGLQARLVRDSEERERRRTEWWDAVHERNSDRMLDICLSMRGFYLKAGQFLGTRPDFMPMPYIIKLSTLHDRVPPIPEAQIRKVLEEELGRPIEEVFSFINLATPVGSASICQVHEGRLRTEASKKAGERVAVKLQYPQAESVMRSDLENIRKACVILERTDLKFDLSSMCRELQKQLAMEFDFRIEAESLRRVGAPLQNALPFIAVPQPYLATRRLLVMSFLDGVSISRLEELEARKRAGSKRRLATRILTLGLAGRGSGQEEGSRPPLGVVGEGLKRRVGLDLIRKMADAWGWMMFNGEAVHCDNHPGNILLMKGMKLGILDWGQTKRLEPKLKQQLARLFVAMGKGQPEAIKREFYRLGIVTEKEDTAEEVTNMVFSIFDCIDRDPRWGGNPFDKNHKLNDNAVLSFPQDLMYIMRAIQIMRGMSVALGQQFSLATTWAPLAQAYLNREKDQDRIRELEDRKEVDLRRGVVI